MPLASNGSCSALVVLLGAKEKDQSKRVNSQHCTSKIQPICLPDTKNVITDINIEVAPYSETRIHKGGMQLHEKRRL